MSDQVWEFERGSQMLEYTKAPPKLLCCSCGREIAIKPPQPLSHGWYTKPVLLCGARLTRQLQYQKQKQTLYLCERCYQSGLEDEHLHLEHVFNIPRD